MRSFVVLSSLLLVACEGDAAIPPQAPSPAKAPATPVEPQPEPQPQPTPNSPSNEPAQTWTQVWATPTGHQTTTVAAIHDGRIYAYAGQYFAFGLPSDHLVSLDEKTGELQWTFKGDDMLTLAGFGPGVVGVRTDEGPTKILEVARGTVDARKEPVELRPIPEASHGCTSEGPAVRCGDWTVTEAGLVQQLTGDGDRVCYGVEGPREVRCRSAKTGDLQAIIDVPPVPGVKYERAVNFTLDVAADRVIIGNYDGTVLCYGPT